jgi:hypothetical protein
MCKKSRFGHLFMNKALQHQLIEWENKPNRLL